MSLDNIPPEARAAVEAVLPFASKDGVRWGLNGVCLAPTEVVLSTASAAALFQEPKPYVALATDGHRLAAMTFEVSPSPILEWLQDSNQWMDTWAKKWTTSLITREGRELVAIEGSFPDVQQIIQTKPPQPFSLGFDPVAKCAEFERAFRDLTQAVRDEFTTAKTLVRDTRAQLSALRTQVGLLRKRKAALRAEFKTLKEKLPRDYPALVDLQDQLLKTQGKVTAETAALRKAVAHADRFQAATRLQWGSGGVCMAVENGRYRLTHNDFELGFGTSLSKDPMGLHPKYFWEAIRFARPTAFSCSHSLGPVQFQGVNCGAIVMPLRLS